LIFHTWRFDDEKLLYKLLELIEFIYGWNFYWKKIISKINFVTPNATLYRHYTTSSASQSGNRSENHVHHPIIYFRSYQTHYKQLFKWKTSQQINISQKLIIKTLFFRESREVEDEHNKGETRCEIGSIKKKKEEVFFINHFRSRLHLFSFTIFQKISLRFDALFKKFFLMFDDQTLMLSHRSKYLIFSLVLKIWRYQVLLTSVERLWEF
jgi:hypothetical protein